MCIPDSEKLGCTRTEKRTEKLKSKPTQIFMTRFTEPRLKFALQSSQGSQVEIPRRQGGKEISNSNNSWKIKRFIFRTF